MGLRILTVAALLLLCAAPAAQAGNVIRIASSSNQDVETNGAFVFAQVLQADLEAAGYEVRFYPNSSLGPETQRSELVELGLVHLNISGAQVVQDWSPLFNAARSDFLFDSYEQFDYFLHQSGFLEAVNEEIRASNLMVMDAVFLGGMSGLFNTKHEVASLSGMQDLRLRAMGAEDMRRLDSWGLSGTQVAWEEVSQALQTGIVDGYFNPPLVPVMFGHTRQIRFFTDLRLSPSTRYAVVSREWYDGLDPEARAIVTRALAHAHAANRAWTTSIQNEERRILADADVTFTEISDADREVLMGLSLDDIARHNPPEVLARIMSFVDAARAAQ